MIPQTSISWAIPRVTIFQKNRNGFKYLICHFWDGVQFSGQEYFSHLPIPRESPVLEREIFGRLKDLGSVSYAKFVPRIDSSPPRILITVFQTKDLDLVQQVVADELCQVLVSFFADIEVITE